MNVITRGMRGALRSPIRSGAILLMLAISTGLVLAMLVARSSVEAKINEIKTTTATQLTISPAGFGGGLGGGDALTTEQVDAIKKTSHISSVAAMLTDQLGENDTNLQPSLELGNLGKRVMRFEKDGDGAAKTFDDTQKTPAEMPKPRTMITGTTDPKSTIAGTSLVSGEMINGSSGELGALVGKNLAEKNNLAVGSTFTAYGQTLTVKGIFSTNNEFKDSGLIVPLATLQNITDQKDAVSSITATVDSSDNVASTVATLKTTLGDKADIISQEEQAKNIIEPLEGISGLALVGVIGAATAAGTIILLSMIMVVRERRREIGVIKAIGGTNSKVIAQFIIEGLTLTIVGSIIGIAFGIAVSGPITQSLVNGSQSQGMPNGKSGGPVVMIEGPGALSSHLQGSVKDITATLTPQIINSSVGIVLLIAIVGSAVPAWAIARIRPAEILRTE